MRVAYWRSASGIQKPARDDDKAGVTIDEDLIQEALLRVRPSHLDDLLTTIEAYRTCVRTADHLQRTRSLQEHRDQALDCAGTCRKALQKYTSSGQLSAFPRHESGEAHFTFTLRA